MGSSIWSADPSTFLSMPAVTFARFFDNHGLLTYGDQPSWRTVVGGSRRYVEAVLNPLGDAVRLSCPVSKLKRTAEGVEIHSESGLEHYDHVVVATHSDQALHLLSDPSELERDVLGAIRYQPNRATLHTDTSLLPRNRRAWASWNYHRLADQPDAATLTYRLRSLQGIESTPRAPGHPQPRRRHPTRPGRGPVRLRPPRLRHARHRRPAAPRGAERRCGARGSAVPTGDTGSTRTASRVRSPCAVVWPARTCDALRPGEPSPGSPGANRAAGAVAQRTVRGRRHPPSLHTGRPPFLLPHRHDLPRPGRGRPALRASTPCGRTGAATPCPSAGRTTWATRRCHWTRRCGTWSRGGPGDRPAGPIGLLTHLRTWGWLFNPISVYYCFEPTGSRWSRRSSR